MNKDPATILLHDIILVRLVETSGISMPHWQTGAKYIIIIMDPLRYSDPQDRIFYRAFSDISEILRETTLTI